MIARSICNYVAGLSMAGLLLYAVFIGAVIFAIYRIAIYPFFLSPFRHVPSPPGASLLLGHGAAMFQQPPGHIFHRWMKSVPNDGVIHFRGLLNIKSRLVLTTPSALAEILTQKPYDFVKPPEGAAFLKKVLGDGLVVVEGGEHKFQRRKLTPAFQGKHIQDLHPLFWSKSCELIDYLKANVNTGEDVVKISKWASRATLDIIGVAALGRNFESLKHPDGKLVKQYEYISEPSAAKLLYFIFSQTLPAWIADNLPTKTRYRMDAATNALHDMCKTLVADKRRLEKTESERSVDILSILMRTESFNDDQLVDQLLTFLAAGYASVPESYEEPVLIIARHETTSSSITWSMYVLATRPEIQHRLRQEIHEHIRVADSSTEVTFETIDKMEYLNAVCNETLRFYPTVPITLRQAIRDTSLQGVLVPKGTPILLCMWAINRLTSIWGADAEIFNPERWISSESSNKVEAARRGGSSSPFGLLTFLHGPRSCIGQGFARAEMKCLLAALVGSFEFDLADPNADFTPTGAITIKPRSDLLLRLRPVKNGSN